MTKYIVELSSDTCGILLGWGCPSIKMQFRRQQICSQALMHMHNPSHSVKRIDEKNTVNLSAGILASFNAFLIGSPKKIKF